VRKEFDRVLLEKNLELQRTTALAERANQAKSDFLSSMSHELRTPLNSILGFAQLLESGTPELTTLQQRNIQMVLRGGWYLLALINEILDLLSIESGKLALSLEPVAISQVLADCQSLIAPQAERSGIQVNFPVLSDSLVVTADPLRLKQVIVNLLSNAIKYNRVNGVVDVTVSSDAQQTLCIRVQDMGEGLSEENMSQLFQPFNRLGQEAKGTEGTGTLAFDGGLQHDGIVVEAKQPRLARQADAKAGQPILPGHARAVALFQQQQGAMGQGLEIR
jgi:signal transduction histidine kinase